MNRYRWPPVNLVAGVLIAGVDVWCCVDVLPTVKLWGFLVLTMQPANVGCQQVQPIDRS